MSDEAATGDTAGIMAAVIREDSLSSLVRTAAAAAIAGTPQTDAARLAAVHRWIRQHVKFREDSAIAAALRGLGITPADTEVLIRPADLLRMPVAMGDCDDFSMLAAAMLRSLGYRVALVTIAADPAAPHTYSHVYVVVHTAKGDIAIDASHGPRAGWYAPAAGKARVWEVDSLQRTLGDTNWIDVPTYGPAAPASSGMPSWATNLITIGAQAGADIARMAATPTGYYQQVTPQGTTTLRQQPGAAAFTLPGTSLGTSGTTLLVFGGIAAVVLIALQAAARRN